MPRTCAALSGGQGDLLHQHRSLALSWPCTKIRSVTAVAGHESGPWYYLANLGATQPDRVTPEFQSTLGSTMGMAMGGFLGLGFTLYMMAAKRDQV